MLSAGTSILVVEYQPEILNMTRFAAMSFRIHEQPITIHTATSAGEAASLLQTKLATRQGISLITVALIALDLESPGEGLELCRFIREDLRNREMQLYLRLEDKNAIPERSLFDRYYIAGYYTTAEIAEDRLYPLLKIGVYYSRSMARVRVLMQLSEALALAGTKAGIKNVLAAVIPAIEFDNTGRAHGMADSRVVFLFDGEIVAKHPSLRDDDILRRWRLLRQAIGILLSEDGDKYAVNAVDLLIHIPARQSRAEFSYLCPLAGEPPELFAADFCRFARLAATLWKSAE